MSIYILCMRTGSMHTLVLVKNTPTMALGVRKNLT